MPHRLVVPFHDHLGDLEDVALLPLSFPRLVGGLGQLLAVLACIGGEGSER